MLTVDLSEIQELFTGDHDPDCPNRPKGAERDDAVFGREMARTVLSCELGKRQSCASELAAHVPSSSVDRAVRVS